MATTKVKNRRTPKRKRFTVEEARGKPTLRPTQAFDLLDYSPSAGYRAIKDGTFPCPFIVAGPRTIRIPTAPLLRLLGEND